MTRTVIPVLFAAAGLAVAAPANATVKEGVEKWRAGDYKGAVTEWLPYAARGDADASFNLGQAYKLGRGVSKDLKVAQDYYRKAAISGHGPARTNLGILLFQSGQKAEGLRWLEQAANQGESRAQYIVGIAYFNGDTVPKNWPLAYAYMLRANNAGVPQAASAIETMNVNMPIGDRTRGEEIARAMANGVPAQTAAAAQPTAPRRIPNPAPKLGATPSPVSASASVPAPTPAPATVAASTPSAARAQAAMASKGGWRIQLGAFSQREVANEAWVSLKNKLAALASATPMFVASGDVVRLQLGPFAQRDEARRLCSKLESAGQGCFVIAAP